MKSEVYIVFCSKCGKQLPEDAIFCSFCGAKVSTVAQEPVKSAPAMPTFERPVYDEPVKKEPVSSLAFDWSGLIDEPKKKVIPDNIRSPWDPTGLDEEDVSSVSRVMEKAKFTESSDDFLSDLNKPSTSPSRTMSFIDMLRAEREEKERASQEAARPVTEVFGTSQDFTSFDEAPKMEYSEKENDIFSEMGTPSANDNITEIFDEVFGEKLTASQPQTPSMPELEPVAEPVVETEPEKATGIQAELAAILGASGISSVEKDEPAFSIFDDDLDFEEEREIPKAEVPGIAIPAISKPASYTAQYDSFEEAAQDEYDVDNTMLDLYDEHDYEDDDDVEDWNDDDNYEVEASYDKPEYASVYEEPAAEPVAEEAPVVEPVAEPEVAAEEPVEEVKPGLASVLAGILGEENFQMEEPLEPVPSIHSAETQAILDEEFANIEENSAELDSFLAERKAVVEAEASTRDYYVPEENSLADEYADEKLVEEYEQTEEQEAAETDYADFADDAEEEEVIEPVQIEDDTDIDAALAKLGLFDEDDEKEEADDTFEVEFEEPAAEPEEEVFAESVAEPVQIEETEEAVEFVEAQDDDVKFDQADEVLDLDAELAGLGFADDEFVASVNEVVETPVVEEPAEEPEFAPVFGAAVAGFAAGAASEEPVEAVEEVVEAGEEIVAAAPEFVPEKPETDAMSLEELESSIFGEDGEENGEAEATRKIDKFYTLYKKNEEFQKLLDEEYSKLQGVNTSEDIDAFFGVDGEGEAEEEKPNLIEEFTAQQQPIAQMSTPVSVQSNFIEKDDVEEVLEEVDPAVAAATAVGLDEAEKVAKASKSKKDKKAEKKAAKKKAKDDDDDDDEGGSGCLTAIAVVIAVILVIVLAAILIINFVPDSGIGIKLTSFIENITSYFSLGDINDGFLL